MRAVVFSCSSPFILYVVLVCCCSSIASASDRPSLYTVLFGDETQMEPGHEHGWQTATTTDDGGGGDSVEASQRHRASYQHDQALLDDIYSPNRTYVSMHDDRVSPSNFSYFTFHNLGVYRIILISSRGDADLYLSTRDKQVSYDNYEFSSCTCGIDEVFVDFYTKRPIYIGIYGYSQYQVSHYRLLIELIQTSKPTENVVVLEEFVNDRSSEDLDNDARLHVDTKAPRGIVVDKEDRPNHVLWNILIWLLNFLLEVLT